MASRCVQRSMPAHPALQSRWRRLPLAQAWMALRGTFHQIGPDLSHQRQSFSLSAFLGLPLGTGGSPAHSRAPSRAPGRSIGCSHRENAKLKKFAAILKSGVVKKK